MTPPSEHNDSSSRSALAKPPATQHSVQRQSSSRKPSWASALTLLGVLGLTSIAGSQFALAAEPGSAPKAADTQPAPAKAQAAKKPSEAAPETSPAPTDAAKKADPKPAAHGVKLSEQLGRGLSPEEKKAAQAAYRSAREALRKAKAQHQGKSADKAQAPTEDEKRARAALIEARRELRKLRSSKSVHFAGLSDEQREKFKKALKELDAERSTTRKERAEAHRERLKKELGERSKRKDVHEELKAHAWRMARLKRLAELAKLSKNEKAEARAVKLMEQEQTRHQTKLKSLKGAKQ